MFLKVFCVFTCCFKKCCLILHFVTNECKEKAYCFMPIPNGMQMDIKTQCYIKICTRTL